MTTISTGQTTELLQGRGERMTRGRRHVIDALIAAQGHHQSAEQILEAVCQVDSRAHRGSVYRILDAFTASGLIHQVHLPQAATVYQFTRDTGHGHLYCSTCRQVADLPASILDPITRDIARVYDFTLEPPTIALTGHCSHCHELSR